MAFAGFSMIQNPGRWRCVRGTIKIPKNTIMKMEDIVKLPDNQITVVCTSSELVLNTVLNRMATGAHKYMKLRVRTFVVFSSSQFLAMRKAWCERLTV